MSKNTPEYTPAQLRSLKSQAHELKPIIWIGQKGVSPSLIENVEEGLRVHELIKVKFHEKDDIESLLGDIIKQTNSTHVQTIGKTVILYKPNPEKPKIKP